MFVVGLLEVCICDEYDDGLMGCEFYEFGVGFV